MTIWLPEVEDFVEAHDQASRVSEIRTEGFMHSQEKGMRKIENILEDTDSYSDPYMAAAYLLRETVKNQPFSDGNHRTGIILAKQTLRKNDESFNVSKMKSADEIKNDLKWNLKHSEVDEIANWIQKGTFS